MGKAGKSVLAYRQNLRLRPGCIASLACINLCITWIIAVERADCQVHRLAIRRETTSTFLVFAIQFTFKDFHGFPLAFVVFLREEDVCTFGTCDATYLIAFGIVPGAAEIKHIALVAKQGRAEVASTAGQDRFLLDAVKRERVLPFGCQLATFQAVESQCVARNLFEEGGIGLDGTLVVTVLLLKLSEIEQSRRVGIAITNGILISTNGLCRIVDTTVTLCHLPCSLTAFVLVFRLCP